MDWTEGYRTEVAYTHGYYKEMNPAFMRFALILAGFQPVAVSEACELGYGQGVSINIHAATENVAWTGTDFNPEQAAFAQELARVSGARIHCHAEPFHDFCERRDLPEFDFIALHGIWSWISPENRAAIVRLVDSRLRIGGCLYISYNANPGWAAFRPA
ncbi:MAG: class I SAM-dependent methyltransferase, partial [Desulfovibrio sp.]|nr:class I SAM-dependent methyltransferase [Desulfovibrio sp.]